MPRETREREILEAAREVFAQHGYERASMDEIARHAGISKPIVYQHYGSKDRLYLACVGDARRRLRKSIVDAASGASEPDEQIWRGLLAFFTFAEEQAESWWVLFGDVVARRGRFAKEGAAIRREQAELIEAMLAATLAGRGTRAQPGELGALAHALIGASLSLALWWREHPNVPRERVVGRAMNFAWTGLGALLDGERWEPPEAR